LHYLHSQRIVAVVLVLVMVLVVRHLAPLELQLLVAQALLLLLPPEELPPRLVLQQLLNRQPFSFFWLSSRQPLYYLLS